MKQEHSQIITENGTVYVLASHPPDQLTKENLLVTVQAVHDQIHEPVDLPANSKKTPTLFTSQH
jgi:hypothetical protein